MASPTTTVIEPAPSTSAGALVRPLEPAAEPAVAGERRLTFIDGLRGIAALAVLVYHFYGQVTEVGPGRLPMPLHQIVEHGWLGVEVFFVISGFVIAHSVYGARITPGFAGNFALRRSLRLDPTYWLVIWISFGLLLLSNRVNAYGLEVPSIGEVFLNMAYLDNLAGARSVVAVGWSLCLEVQFYLAFIVMLAVAQRLGGSLAARVVVFAPPLLLAAAGTAGWFAFPRGLFLEYWHMFFVGVLARWVWSRDLAPGWLYGTWAGLLALSLVQADLRTTVVVATAAAIHLAGRRGELGTALAGRVFQYFGRISYALYLIHPTVGHRVIRLGARVLGEGIGSQVALFVRATLASVAAALALHVAVERPTMLLAKRFRPRLQLRSS